MLPAVVLSDIRTLLQSVRDIKARISEIIAGLDFLGITEPQIPAGKAGVGILIPRAAVDNNLDEFGEEASDLNRLLNIVAEATTGEVENIQIQSLSTSDILVYVTTSTQVAAAIADSLKHIIQAYAELVGVRIMIEHLGLPPTS